MSSKKTFSHHHLMIEHWMIIQNPISIGIWFPNVYKIHEDVKLCPVHSSYRQTTVEEQM